MPWTEEWEEPEIFLIHEGVTIYHTYKDNSREQGRLTYWFTTNENDLVEECHFDVRDIHIEDDGQQVGQTAAGLADHEKAPTSVDTMSHEALEVEWSRCVIQRAIEKGMLKQDRPVQNK